MSAIIDFVTGRFRLSPAQERLLIAVERNAPTGRRPSAATHAVLLRLGIVERSATHLRVLTKLGEALARELVAREEAQGEYLPTIYWSGDGYGHAFDDRFRVTITADLGEYALDDLQEAKGYGVFSTIVAVQQRVREVLNDEQRAREELEAAQDRGAAEQEAERIAYDRETQRRRAVSLARRTEDVYTRPVSRREAMDPVTGRQGVRVQVEGYQVFAWATRVDDRGVEILIRDLLVDEQVALTVLDPYDVNDELHARTALRRFLIDNVA